MVMCILKVCICLLATKKNTKTYLLNDLGFLVRLSLTPAENLFFSLPCFGLPLERVQSNLVKLGHLLTLSLLHCVLLLSNPSRSTFKGERKLYKGVPSVQTFCYVCKLPLCWCCLFGFFFFFFFCFALDFIFEGMKSTSMYYFNNYLTSLWHILAPLLTFYFSSRTFTFVGQTDTRAVCTSKQYHRENKNQ